MEEQNLIILLDVETRKIYLYGKYNREFSFNEMYILKTFLEDKNAIFVTQAEEMDINDIENVISAIPDNENFTVEKKYFRVNTDGYTLIPELKMRFAGPKDCKPVEQFGYDIFEKSPTMAKLLKCGKLEILTEDEVLKVKKPKPRPQQQSIILDKNIKDIDGNLVFENDTIFTEDNEISEKTSVESDVESILKSIK